MGAVVSPSGIDAVLEMIVAASLSMTGVSHLVVDFSSPSTPKLMEAAAAAVVVVFGAGWGQCFRLGREPML
jgi:hypothetical protein